MQKAKSRETLKVLLTAGPTRAYLDRVRFLSNFSTGELGFLTAEILSKKGVEVMAVVGPCCQPFENLKLKKLIRVETNEEMEAAIFQVLRQYKPAWGIFSAAVLDFKPRRREIGKTSSRRGGWKIDLVPTHKITDRVSMRHPELKKIGFKLEWKSLRGKQLHQFGKQQLTRKGYKGLVVNFLPEVKSAIHHRAYLFSNKQNNFSTAKTKSQIAKWIATQIV